MAFTYRSRTDLQRLGEEVRDLAIKTILKHAEEYGMAQQRANNAATQQQQPVGSAPPTQGRPDDDARIRDFIDSEFAGIPAMFTAFAIPNPDHGEPVADTLLQTAAALNKNRLAFTVGGVDHQPPYLGPMTPTLPLLSTTEHVLHTRMQHWTGPAADAFRGYLETYQISGTLQHQLAATLAVLLRIQLEIRRRMLDDVWQTGQKAKDALEELYELRCPTTQGLAVVLTVVGAIAAIIGGIEGGPSVIGLFLGEALPATASLITSTGPLLPPRSLAGGSVPEVIASMRNALGDIVEATGHQQQDLANALGKLGDQAAAFANQLLMPAPLTGTGNATRAQLDDAQSPTGFYDR